MKFPEWFKVGWWLLLLVGLSGFLFLRLRELADGRASTLDAFVFTMWIALCMLPLVQEIGLFGLTLKKEIESLRTDVRTDIARLRADIQNTVDVRSHFNPSFTFTAPSPDSALPAIEEQVRNVLDEFVLAHDSRAPAMSNEELRVGRDENLLFSARFNIEKELRRIWREWYGEDKKRPPPNIHDMSRMLVDKKLLDFALIDGIREVWAVATPAIHGKEVSRAQVEFVKKVAPNLISALRAV